jgi:Flp pilus assembly protein TadD
VIPVLARPLVAVVLVASLASALRAAQPPDCGAPYDCAVAAIEHERFAEAIRTLRGVLRTSPSNLKALNLLGIALTGAGRVDDADVEFRRALTVDPQFYPARKNLAINLFNRGRLADAHRHFTRVLASAPNDEVANVYLGEIAFQQKHAAAAVTHFAKGGATLASNADGLLHYAVALLQSGDAPKAEELLDRLPADAYAQRFDAAVALGQSGDYIAAARMFASARTGYKEPYAAAYNELLMLVEAGEYDSAITAGRALLTQSPRPAEVQSLLARAYDKSGKVKEAYDALRESARLEPTNEDHYLDLAGICIDHENYDLGLEIVGVGLQYRPDSWLLQLQRGVLWAMKAQLDQAEQAFEAARRLARERSAPLAALAMVWMQTGRAAKAVETLRAEARTRANDYVVPYMFAVALVRSGVDPASPEAVEAVDALRAATRANASFAPAHSELGRLLLKRDDVDGAIGELEQATRLDTTATSALYNLAQAYRRKGDRTRAAELLARVNALNTQKRGDDPDQELKQVVIRIVRDGAARPAAAP